MKQIKTFVILLLAVIIFFVTIIIFSIKQKKAVYAPANNILMHKVTKITITPTSHTQLPMITVEETNPAISANVNYKDGIYTGTPADALYGNIQVQIVVTDGKMTQVDFLQYPNDQPTSHEINQYAAPILGHEAIQAQSANVDLITSASLTTEAFKQSLQSALMQAKG